jgi:hypothetical protein
MPSQLDPPRTPYGPPMLGELEKRIENRGSISRVRSPHHPYGSGKAVCAIELGEVAATAANSAIH